jgi:hypothetical protein
MKKTTLAVLVGALLCGAAIGTTSAAPVVSDRVIARGADDARPPQCDDHGTDLCKSAGEGIAKNGADDPRPPQCDDHGTDLCKSAGESIAKNGADDPRPPQCDDHGTDLCKNEA